MNRVLLAVMFIIAILGIVLMVKSTPMMYVYFVAGLVLYGAGCYAMGIGKGSTRAFYERRDETRDLET